MKRSPATHPPTHAPMHTPMHPCTHAHMLEQTFKNIDDILYKDSGADSELDFIVTPTNHCNIAREEEVLRQIAFFFVHGTFDELPAK